EWEQAFDIDDSDFRLTLILCLNNNLHILPKTKTTTQTLVSYENHQVDNYGEKSVRIIPGHVGIVQAAMLRKIADIQEGGEDSVMFTQEYIRKVIKEVGEDDDFMYGSWLSAVEFVNVDWGIVSGCFEGIKKFLKNEKLKKVVAIIKYCILNTLGDLTVRRKDRNMMKYQSCSYGIRLSRNLLRKDFVINTTGDCSRKVVER
nr:hypothetical protein [Tanacetum cinerariifolium]